MIARLKLYFLAVGAAMLAFWGIYGVGFTRGKKASENRNNADRLEAIKTAKEIEDEIQDDPYFVDRASRWVHDDPRR